MHGYPSQNPVLFTLFVLAAFIGAWLFAAAFVSRVSGWHELAKRFTLQSEFPSQRFRLQSARMKNWMNYNNCVTVAASPVGRSLEMLWLFKHSHPALFIPWTEISWVRTKILWLPMVQFQLGRENPVPFAVRESLAERIRQATGASWPAEAPTR